MDTRKILSNFSDWWNKEWDRDGMAPKMERQAAEKAFYAGYKLRDGEANDHMAIELLKTCQDLADVKQLIKEVFGG